MNLIEKFVTTSPCYKSGKAITPKGLMIHSVGCSQPDPEVFIKTWNKADAGACAHAVIGQDGVVLQALPWNRRGWHCASKANDTHIGVEMTEPAFITYTSGSKWKLKPGHSYEEVKKFAANAYATAVELFAYLCRKYDLDPLADGVVISHKEGHARGLASNHGDVEHIWDIAGLTMAQFRQDVKAAMLEASKAPIPSSPAPSPAEPPILTPTVDNGSSPLYRVRKSWNEAVSQIGAFKVLEFAKKLADSNPGYKVFGLNGVEVYSGVLVKEEAPAKPSSSANPADPSESSKPASTGSGSANPASPEGSSSSATIKKVPFFVKVKVDSLRIRESASSDAKVVGQIKDHGVYTIIEVSPDGKWGLLKSKAGWISLEFTEPLKV